MGKPGRDGAPSPVNPGDSTTRQEVRLGGPPTRTRWGGYHLARPGGPPWAERLLVPAKSNLKPHISRELFNWLYLPQTVPSGASCMVCKNPFP